MIESRHPTKRWMPNLINHIHLTSVNCLKVKMYTLTKIETRLLQSLTTKKGNYMDSIFDFSSDDNSKLDCQKKSHYVDNIYDFSTDDDTEPAEKADDGTGKKAGARSTGLVRSGGKGEGKMEAQ